MCIYNIYSFIPQFIWLTTPAPLERPGEDIGEMWDRTNKAKWQGTKAKGQGARFNYQFYTYVYISHLYIYWMSEDSKGSFLPKRI